MIFPLFCNIRNGVLLAASFLLVSCARQREAPPAQAAAERPAAVPYALDAPDATFELPRSLREISGLTVVDPGHVAAIQDEEGVIFVIDLQTGDVSETRRFDKHGDYEDLVLLGSRMYVLRSDGTLFEVENWRSDDPDVHKHDADLGSRCDAEGLAYDAAHERLLIACKHHPDRKLKGEDERAIYAFDLRDGKRLKEPAYTIPLKPLAPFLRTPKPETLAEKTRVLLEGSYDERDFKPAAIAFHPTTGELWVLSSVAKAIVLLHPDGSLHTVLPLPARLFPQPEGLAFLPGGDLLISNEGGKGRGTLLRFNYRTNHD